MRKPKLMTLVGNLTLVHRDVRVADASRLFIYSDGRISRSDVFARSVFQRYGFAPGCWQRPEHIVRLSRFLQNTFNEHRYFLPVNNRHIRQCLIVKVDSILNQIYRNKTVQGKLISVREQTIKRFDQSNDRVKTTVVSGEERRLLQLAHVQNIVQRLIKRNVRIEENRFQQNAQRTVDSPKSEYLNRAPFVIREPRKPVETIVRAVGTQEQPKNGLQHPDYQALASRQQNDLREINSVNIKNLTDQIVRTIDQRIIAQRERMGRG